eukprot:CAMPEP_0172660584 /NCGR_PEP_ID=MMETSP1074-20121228/4145_1 /TAXON_ID=2916 /ORGANISM="Ceratium fusus, Strain PA161109" /LENGTH=297 /DNA_ID=CAMNT_0013476215 /DNA_START=49 /DNA_END=942 /DNA_ORIENTATION=+
MHVILIRHGQSSNNLHEAALGMCPEYHKLRSADPALSPLGEAQAEHLARHFAPQISNAKDRVRLFCSSMTRAMQTLEPLAKSLSLNPVVHPDLYELEGFFLQDAHAHGPKREEIMQRFAGFDASLIPEGGQEAETVEEAWLRVLRVASWLRKMAAEGQDDDIVVIVAHNDFIGQLSKQLLVPSISTPEDKKALKHSENLFSESYWPMNNTGITHIVLGVKPPEGAYKVDAYLLYWNRSDHLSEELRSGIQFKNIGFGGAAAWARVGKGGTNVSPAFSEHAVVKSFSPPNGKRKAEDS